VASFKVKLVAYFLLLSLLPLAAAFWGFSTVAARSETRRVDARLQAGLRAGLATYQDELVAADDDAAQLARNLAFQRALSVRDRAAIERCSEGTRISASRRANGSTSAEWIRRREPVRSPSWASAGRGGAVIASVPLDRRLVGRLEGPIRSRRRRARHPDRGQARGRRPVDTIGSRFDAQPGKTHTLTVLGTRTARSCRHPERPSLCDDRRDQPADAHRSANHAAMQRLLAGLFACLLLVASVAYIEGRAIVRTLRRLVDATRAISRGDLEQRVPVQGRDEFALLGRTFNEMAAQLQTRLDELERQRGRLRDVIARFGEALGATHDADQLMRLIVEAAVEATSAEGGVIISSTGELVQAGTPGQGADKIEVPLSAGEVTFGSLLLFGDGFEDEDRMTAVSLASHAVVALDNARCIESSSGRPSSTASPGSPNRRQCEDTLASSSRARALRRLARRRRRRPRLVQGRERPLRPSLRAMPSCASSRSCCRRPSATSTSPAAGAGRSSCSSSRAPTWPAAPRSPSAIRLALAGRIVLSADGSPIPVTASFGVAATRRRRRPPSSSPPPTPPSTRRSGTARTGSRPPPRPSRIRRGLYPSFVEKARGGLQSRRSSSPPPPSSGEPMPVETPSLFAKVIQDHLELKERNSRLDDSMPLTHYKNSDPFDNHPLFKTEEQARLEETMDGEEPAVVDSSVVLAWPGEETATDVVAHTNEESLWGKSRDFDWGD
jgi:HAMP domain-containing protein